MGGLHLGILFHICYCKNLPDDDQKWQKRVIDGN